MDAQQYRKIARFCRLVARTQRARSAMLSRRMAADFDRIADRLDHSGARGGLLGRLAESSIEAVRSFAPRRGIDGGRAPQPTIQ